MTTCAYRVARAATWLKAAFAVAVGMNLAEVVWDPAGAGWRAARVAASVLFTVALVAYVVLRVLRWRRARSERP
jgi:ethanolamine utilization microcompartment shell protein EutL